MCGICVGQEVSLQLAIGVVSCGIGKSSVVLISVYLCGCFSGVTVLMC
jgi:hypothetical protein